MEQTLSINACQTIIYIWRPTHATTGHYTTKEAMVVHVNDTL